MSDDVKQIDEEAKIKDNEMHNSEIKFQQIKFQHQQYLFYGILAVSISIIISIGILIRILFIQDDAITTQETIIVVSIATIPVIMMLALMRYVYDGKKSDTPQPTLILNVGKELAGVIQEIIKTK